MSEYGFMMSFRALEISKTHQAMMCSSDWLEGGGEFVKDAVGLSWFMCWIGKLWWRLLTKQVRERFQALMVSHSSASLGSSTLVGTLDLWENKLFSSWWCCWISSRPSERYLRVYRSLHVFCGLWDRGGFWGVFCYDQSGHSGCLGSGGVWTQTFKWQRFETISPTAASFWFAGLRIASLLLLDDVVLLASSVCSFQL